MKRKLLLAALCVVGALGMRAQTNYVAAWDGAGNTSAPTNFGWASTNNGRSWGALNGGGARMTNNYTGYKLENGSSYSYSGTSDPSSMLLWIRYADNNADTYTYTFNGLEAGHFYRFSGLVGWHNNSSNPTFTIAVEGTTSYGSISKSISTKQTLYEVGFAFDVPDNEEATSFKLKFTCSAGGDCMEALSALKLVDDFAAYEAELSKFIAYATQVNTKLSDSDLATAISTAQGIVDDGEDNATFDDVDDLKTAISTAISSYSLDPAGDDVSSLYLLNSGFDIDINFSSSSSTATSAATVYPTFGWTPTVPGNSTGATIGYGYSGAINGSGNVTAPTQNADGTNDGGALVICVGWSGQVTYKSLAKTFPAGSYRITYRAYNGNTKNTSAIEAIPLVGFVPTTGDAQINAATESFTNQAWTTHTYDFVLADDTEGQIQIGLKPTSNTNSYNAPELFIDEVKLEYFNPLVLAQIQWQEVHDALEALDETALPDAAETAITTELAKAVPTTTVDDVNNAKAALQALIDSYDDIKAAYDKVNDLITLATNEKTYSTGDKDDLTSAISTASTDKETRTTAEALTTDYNTLETARQTYVTSGAEPTAGHPFDWTFKLSNPSFEEGTTGWTLDRNTTGQWNYGRSQNDPVDGAYNLDAWAPQINYIKVYQTVTLPLGSYSLKGYLFSADLKSQHIYAYTTYDNPSSNLSTASSWEQLTADFTQSSESEASVELGIYSQGENVSGNTKGWFRADHFQLFYNGIKPLLNDLIVSTTDLSAINVGTGAFQIPSSAVETLTTAIGDAQDVYDDNDATGSDVQNAMDDLNAAIETYQAAELNAPVSGVQYRIKSTAADGASWKNKYYVLKKNPNQPNGGYSTQAEVETTDAFYATAWEFVLVSGNQYKLRMTDADGDVRYLCTNITGYDQGSATQIRTTTDANKALVVKVIAATGTEGRWFLQNTEDNSYLGGQDAGLFSNSQNYDLAIEAADKASVNVTIDAAVKYATRIFPFAAAIPDGVTAYSCAAVVGNTLTLVEKETSFDANTPYILEATSGLASTDLTGWGTAGATSYNVGLLTGVYTNTDAEDGWYVLQNNNGKVGFYQVDDVIPTVGANRCYLTIGGGGSAKAFFFPGDDEATVIEGLDALTAGEYEAIYTLGGVKVNALQKGTNIVQLKSGKTLKINVK